jgi:RNA polymerase sigma-70 factor (ECF subfamily)
LHPAEAGSYDSVFLKPLRLPRGIATHAGRLPMMWSTPDDLRKLVRLCLVGDQPAMMALVERFRGQVFGLCYRMLGQRQDAEDAAQETFVRVLKNLHRWDPLRDFEPWLFAIAGNRCRTALAVRRRRPASESAVEHLPDDAPDSSPADHLAEELHLALAGLRVEYRQAFILFHEQELSYAHIAEALDVPLGTVKTWVHRARRELIDILRERGAIESPLQAIESSREAIQSSRETANQDHALSRV